MKTDFCVVGGNALVGPAHACLDCLNLEASNDPIAQLVLNTVEKSQTFESWLTWLRSRVGAGVVIESQTTAFLVTFLRPLKDYRINRSMKVAMSDDEAFEIVCEQLKLTETRDIESARKVFARRASNQGLPRA